MNKEENYISVDEAAFHSKKHMTLMFKQFLFMLEDLKYNHDRAFSQLRLRVPKESLGLVEAVDYFDEALFSRYRKRVLDFSNQIIKNCQNDLE